ncbi:MAG: hypothetical protein CMJ48_02345 [Planctomycetaceae bacterium]|nr:hypothetical protein [Planctomycetaceae bacterium]
MSQVLTMTAVTSDLVSGLAAVCDVPFEFESVSAIAKQNGWKLIPPEDWETAGDPFLRIQMDAEHPSLLALWGAETLAGVPLAVIYQDDVTVGLTDETIAAFETQFNDAKRTCDAKLGPPTIAGTYTSDHQPFPLNFALYQRRHSTFALLQHDEGDGHLGNDASLDIRIVPGSADRIELPLETNLIF